MLGPMFHLNINNLDTGGMHLQDCFTKASLRCRSHFRRFWKAIHCIESHDPPESNSEQTANQRAALVDLNREREFSSEHRLVYLPNIGGKPRLGFNFWVLQMIENEM